MSERKATVEFAKSFVNIVDDDSAVCGGIKRLVESIGLKANVFSDAQGFLDGYDESVPGCLVLDIRMPNISGTKLQSMLIEKKVNTPIIFITGHGDVATATKVFKEGAFDFLEKPFNEQILLERIQEALAQDIRDRNHVALYSEAEKRYQGLSNREKQVLDLVMDGKPNKVIALELDISQSTVELHRSNVMKKMQAESLPELVTLTNKARENN